MKIKALFRVVSVTHQEFGYHDVLMRPVSDDGIPEHERFHRATPNGECKMSVTNPAVAEFFAPGRLFYVDFTPAEHAKPPTVDQLYPEHPKREG